MHGDRKAAGGRAHGSLPQLEKQQAAGRIVCVYVLREREKREREGGFLQYEDPTARTRPAEQVIWRPEQRKGTPSLKIIPLARSHMLLGEMYHERERRPGSSWPHKSAEDCVLLHSVPPSIP